MTDDLRVLLKKALKTHGVSGAGKPVTAPWWGPEMHGLEKTAWWRGLAEPAQDHFLKTWQQVPLREAFHIEKAGMAYGARMSLRARSLEEQSFFCLMAEEECAHFHALSPWFDPLWPAAEPGPFEALILRIVDQTDRVSSLLLIQVLLEGWGLQHYADLLWFVRDEGLRGVFQRILRDEARHHAGGLLLLRPERKQLNREAIRPFIDRLLEMVRVGPWSLMETAAQAGAAWGLREGVGFLAELRAREKTARNLKRLKTLLEKAFEGDLDFLKLADREFQAPTETEMWKMFSAAHPRPPADAGHALDPEPAPTI